VMTLMEKLTRQTLFDTHDDDDVETIMSIKQHLTDLLNTKQESVPHLVDFGLPDIAEVYRGLPFAAGKLAREIQNIIEIHEPRLSRVTAKLKGFREGDGVMLLEITAYTSASNKKVKFETELTPNDLVHIA